MDFQATRHLVLDFVRYTYLKQGGHIQLPALFNELIRFVREKMPNAEQILHNVNDEDVLDIVNSLLHEGILRWGISQNSPAPPFIGLTRYGKEVLESDEPIPYDPDGYLKKLKEKFPHLNDVTMMYVVESLETFLRNNFMASAVMLGVASESVFNLLYDQLRDSIQSDKIIQKFEKIRDSANTKQRIDLLRDTVLTTYKSQIPRELTGDFTSKTDPLFNLIRQIRNDAGHPTGIKVDRMTGFTHLQLFVTYCETSYQLIKFLKDVKFN